MAAKLEPGRRARVELEVDHAPRTVGVPSDLARALAAAKARNAFDELSYSRRKEYADSVTSAKRLETRAARIVKAVAEVHPANLTASKGKPPTRRRAVPTG